MAFATLTLNWGLSFYGFSVLNKPIADDFGWSRGGVTTAFFIFQMTAATFSLVAGRLADKHGPRKVLFLGIMVMSLALILLSRTSAVWNFYLLHLCLGIGHALLGPVPISIIVSNWFYRLRGTMLGLAFTGIGMGGLALAPLIGNYLTPNLGWRSAYLVMASLLLAIILPLIFFVIKDHPSQKGLLAYGLEVTEVLDNNGPKIKAASGLSLKEALETPVFWIVVLTSVVYGMALTTPLQNQVSLLSEQGFATASAVAAISVIGLFSALGKFLFGYLCDHINPKYAAAISYTITAGALVTVMQTYSAAHLWLYAVLLGLAHGGWAPNLAMLVASYFGLKHYGTVLGTINLIFMGGGAVGPMIAGFIYDHSGSYHPVLWVFAGLCFVSIPLIATIRKPKIAAD